MKTAFFENLIKICPDSRLNELMKNHTTFRIGGAADFFAVPQNEEELKNVIELCKKETVPYMIIGNGSNMLVSDRGIEGVVISISDNFSSAETNGTKITAGAGILLSRLSKLAYDKGLSGMEFASGIPGTLGGAVYMNAGAYGGEMKDIVTAVTFMDESGELITYAADKLDFGYRKSVFCSGAKIILSVTLMLANGDKEEIKAKMADYTERRTSKQPLNMPSAGSTFKRPEGNYAGTLIEQAGLKGYSIGGAEISEKHAGFIVNKGGATAADVSELIEYVRNDVYKKFSVMLEPEVKIVGR